MIPKEKIAVWQAATDAATEGPWKATKYCAPDDYCMGENWHAMYPDGEDTSIGIKEDAIFIATAREAMPALLAEVERLTAERDELREHAKAR
jgi:hypothetical protein